MAGLGKLHYVHIDLPSEALMETGYDPLKLCFVAAWA